MTDPAESRGRRWWGATALMVPAVAYGAWLAVQQRFVCDDAYISFRYARNLLEGHGLVFNPGEAVEGYTNFAWVLEVAALWVVGVEPPTGALILSGLCTGATLGVTAWWASRGPAPPSLRPWVVACAVVLLATERSFAVWATSGLETRQFTLAVLLGVVLATLPGPRAAVGTSSALAWATLTRPEGLLWAGITLPLVLLDRWRRGTLDRRMLASLTLPFVLPVAMHLLWRRWTYGMWVPNTYIAKHVAPWVDMGTSYFVAVTVESGLWLLVPLALAGFGLRAWRSRSVVVLAGPVCVALHAVFVLRVGGDHFEWRPLDPWWPLLAVGAADALVDVARRMGGTRRAPGVAVAALAVVLLYARVVERAHDREVFAARDAGLRPTLHVSVDAATAPLAWRLPPLSWWMPAYEHHMSRLIEHGSAIRQHRHRSFARAQLDLYGPYLALRDVLDLPDDMIASRGSVGILPYHLPDLEVVDVLGLTDATIARTPVRRKRRHMAHDRRPPAGYLAERGVNVRIGAATTSLWSALAEHDCGVPIDGQTWLTFHTEHADWARTAFAGRGIACHQESVVHHTSNTLFIEDDRWVGHRVVGSFERGWQGWTGTRARWARRRSAPEGQAEVRGFVGATFVDTFHPTEGDEATFSLRSPPVDLPPGAVLALRVGGGLDRDGVSVRLRIDEREVHRWSGLRSELLRYRWLDLSEWAGQTAHIEIIDEGTGPWGHLVVDHVVLLVPG